MPEISLGIDIATFLIVLVTAVYGVYFWNKRRIEKNEYEKIMEDPIEFHFLIPPKKLISLKYDKQDNEDHIKNEIVIPPNFKDHIIILMRPKINMLMNEWYCGFGTPDGKIPQLAYSNVYVVQSSIQNAQWYIDRYGCIHFETKKQYFKDETYLGSIGINTYEKGHFPLELTFNVTSNEYKDVKKEIGRKITKHLSVRVE